MPGEPVVLDMLGGMVATSRPEDLPEGAASRCNDVDFIVGRIIQRPGAQSVYTLVYTPNGPRGGQSAVNVDTEGLPWVNPTNILAQDFNYTTMMLNSAEHVLAVNVTQGGYYQLTDTPTITFTGTTTHPATATINTTSVGGATPYKYVSSVTVTDPGDYSGPVSVTFGGASGSGGGSGTTGSVMVSAATCVADFNGTGSASSGSSSSAVLNITAPYPYLSIADRGYGRATWDFTGVNLPTLPAGAVVTGIFPVVTASGNITVSGTGDSASFYGMLQASCGMPTVGTFSGTYTGLNWGTTMDQIRAGIAAFGPCDLILNYSGNGFVFNDTITVSNFQLQVQYFVPATPYIPGNNATGTVSLSPSNAISDPLLVTDFGFSLDTDQVITGFEVNVYGYSSGADLFVQMVKSGVPVGTTRSLRFPPLYTDSLLGSSTDLWGSTWNSSDVDSTSFGLELWTTNGLPATVFLDYVTITIFSTPPPANFLGLTDANLNQTDQVTIALDANGISWEEDVTNDPNILAIQPIIPKVVPGSYLKGLDANGVAFMAYSDMTQGTSQPMQFNGEWCDRITQVGPGAAPIFTPTVSTSDNFTISTITQVAQKSYGFIYFLQSSGPGSTTPGSVVTIYYADSTVTGADTDLTTAFNSGNAVYLYLSVTGTPSTFGPYTQQITAIGEAQPPGQPRNFFYFTYVVPSVAFTYYQGSGHPGYTVTYQRSLATITTTAPVPGLTVGSVISIVGASVAAWDNTWTISQALDSGSMAITQTSVTSGVATYTYAMTAGVPPAAGQLVTITSTLNDNGILNLTNATIASSTGGSTGSFTIAVSGPNAPTVTEAGQATTAGDIFAFDPGQGVVGTGTTPIYGNSTGGTLTFENNAGQFITPGIRQGVVFFITRNGAVTCPSPPVTFTCPDNTAAIMATQVPIGPPNIVARGFAFTEAGQNGQKGANFYTYSTPVSFVVSGTTFIATPLIIQDNTSTSAQFSFSDSVLLASDEIDIEGNNYFNLKEIGSPAWLFQYADRMLYGLCQTQVKNFLNLTFDGGYLPTGTLALPQPLGWGIGNVPAGVYTITAFQITSNVVTITAANSLSPGLSVLIQGMSTATYLNGLIFVVQSANSTSFTIAFTFANVPLTSDTGTASVTNSTSGLVPSLDFGDAYRILNLGASLFTNPPILYQSCYQDVYGVNIIQPNTPYSVRVKARSLNQDGQQITVRLLTLSTGTFGSTDFGFATFTFNQGSYQIETLPLILGDGIGTVPSNLNICIGVFDLAIGAGVEIDRIEVFPTRHPVETTTIWTSYVNNFEAVDEVTGSLGVGTENPQPATGAFEILEQLYITKVKSLQVTQDSPNYEPNNWQVRQASDGAGAVGPNAYFEGEEFSILAGRNGLYFFDGGKPMPISNELQSQGFSSNIWEAINWNAGNKIWVRNDLNQRRLLIGLPMITPNFWLPNAPSLTPTSPNVILVCNYTGCPTGEEMSMSDEVHVTMFGDMKALDMRRKWVLWQIPVPAAEFITRPDTLTKAFFMCNGIHSEKIYQFINGAPTGGQNTDDGLPINWQYTTYGLTKAKQGQQNPMLGALRKVWYYLAATMEGIGQVSAKLYANSLGALPRNTFTIPLKFTLSYPQQNDQERVLEFGGQRVFIELSSVGTGGYAEIGPLIIDGEMDKNAPHRGVSS